MISQRLYYLCSAALLALAVAAAPRAVAVEVDFDVALIIVGDYLSSGPGLRDADNDNNGMLEDDQLGMLSIILKGGPDVACLNPAMVSAIQAGYQHNLTATRSELTVTVGSQGTVDLLSRLQQTDPQLGTALQSALAGMLTIADTSTLAFINQLADLAVVQVLSNTPESGSIGSVQNQINFTAPEYKTFGNAPPEPNYLGPAGDVDGDGQNNLQEYFDGIVQKTREAWLVDNCLPAPLRVVSLTGGGLRVTGVPETFSVTTAGGVGAPTFQWRKGSTSSFTVLSTDASYTIPFLTVSNSGNYYCVLTDGVTTRQTPIRNLNVVFVPLFFALQPLGASKSVGRSHTFSVRVQGGVGPGPYQYTWRRNNVVVGPNAADYTIPSITVGDAGNYTCTVTSNGGPDAKVSTAATLNVIAGAFSLASQPGNVDAYVGDPVTLTVVPDGGSGLFSYEWRKGGALFGAPNAPSLNFPSLSNADAGTYVCTVRDTFNNQELATDPAVLRVRDPLALTAQPESAQVYVGELVQFSVAATGGFTPLNYEWRWNNLPIQGQNSPNYTSVATLQFTGSYRCQVADENGAIRLSDTASLQVFPALVLQGQIQGGNFYVGEEHALIVNATGGAGALGYTWYKDDEIVPGAASLALAFASLSPGDSGAYRCVVADTFRAVAETQTVTIQVAAVPEITSHPISANLYSGEPYTLGVLVEGGLAPVTYQWRKNGILLPQETGPTINIASAGEAVAGEYQCTVRDARNTTLQSGVATLTVSPRIAITAQPEGQSLYAGGAASFSVSATGGVGNRHYAWYKNDVLVDAPDVPQLDLPNAQPSDTGIYLCVVTDDRSDTVVSNPAVLTVGSPISVLTEPVDAILNEGDTVQFPIAIAGGVGEVDFAWRKGAEPMGVGPVLEIAPLTLNDSGDYACTITDDVGSVDAGVLLRLTVLPADPGSLERASDGLAALYVFEENGDGIVPDQSGESPPADLLIDNPSATRWLEPAGLAIDTATRLDATGGAARLNEAIRDANAVTVEAWLRPAQVFAFSESRVFALAAGRQQRNLTLSQLLDRYEINHRTTATSAAGVPSATLNQSVSTQNLWQVVYTRSADGSTKFYVNSEAVNAPALGGDTSGWNVQHPLTLANDPDGLAPWLGELHLVALYTRALSPQEVIINYLVGPHPFAVDPEEGEGGGEGGGEGDGEIEGEGEGEGSGEGEGEEQNALFIARAVEGNGAYIAGATLDIVVTFTRSGGAPFTQLGLVENLPAGWTFAGIAGGPAPDILPSAGAAGMLNFVWVFVPDPPFNLIYRVNVPLGTVGTKTISGSGIYATDGPQQATAVVQTSVPFGGSIGDPEGEGTAEGEGEGEGDGEGEGTVEGEPEGGEEGEGEGQSLGDAAHSADQNQDGVLNLSELLRVIQFYNSLDYGCQAGSEDGFAPGGQDKSCQPHASDYNPQDWRISLSELLRVIQFYNAGGYTPCPDAGSEDGFCVGAA